MVENRFFIPITIKQDWDIYSIIFGPFECKILGIGAQWEHPNDKWTSFKNTTLNIKKKKEKKTSFNEHPFGT